MGFPRIVYNGKTLDFSYDGYRIQLDYPRRRVENYSASRIGEVLNISADVMHSFAIRWLVNSNATDAALRYHLYEFVEWARQGKAWTFARDSSKASSTTLSAGAAVGDTTLTVTSISGFSSGDLCILRSSTQIELVKINGAPSGNTITLADTLNFDYASGSRFRHEQYMPARLLGNQHPIQERPPLHYDFEIVFTEDMN